MNVFIDTNVLLDVLEQRQPFYKDSVAIWTLAEQGKIAGFVSVISFTNAFYVVRRTGRFEGASRAVNLLRNVFTPVPFDVHVLNQAIDAGFKDFEDAVQYVSAIRAGAQCLVTRNSEHFPDSADCPILTPIEFLSTHSFE